MKYSSQGQLVPDEPTVQLWRQYIENCQRADEYHPGRDTLLLDGIPRMSGRRICCATRWTSGP